MSSDARDPQDPNGIAAEAEAQRAELAQIKHLQDVAAEAEAEAEREAEYEASRRAHRVRKLAASLFVALRTKPTNQTDAEVAAVAIAAAKAFDTVWGAS